MRERRQTKSERCLSRRIHVRQRMRHKCVTKQKKEHGTNVTSYQNTLPEVRDLHKQARRTPSDLPPQDACLNSLTLEMGIRHWQQMESVSVE